MTQKKGWFYDLDLLEIYEQVNSEKYEQFSPKRIEKLNTEKRNTTYHNTTQQMKTKWV